VVSQASLPGQRAVRGPLAEIADLAARAGAGAPAVVVVGDVVGLLAPGSGGEQAIPDVAASPDTL
jgi:siroheme synthase